FAPHQNGLLPPNIAVTTPQYQKLQNKFYRIALNDCDSTFILKNGMIAVVRNIVFINDEYLLVVSKFNDVTEFTNIGLKSKEIGMFLCAALSREIFMSQKRKSREMGTCSRGDGEEDLFGDDISRLSALTRNRGDSQMESRYGSPSIDVKTKGPHDEPRKRKQVDYCVWLAGSNPNKCANLYIKTLLSNGVCEHIRWSGANDTFALKGTRLAEAFEEVMNRNKNFKKVDRAIVAESMRRALRCAKERLRKSRMVAATNNQDPQREMDDDEDEF
ncbi:hypothetical protein PV327_011487, partial [Microctonus hyperodae]